MNATEPWSALVGAAEIQARHDELIQASGGKASLPKPGCIEGSLGAAWNAVLYGDDPGSEWRTELPFAGYLLFYLVNNNCFIDGNKRTGLSAAQEVLAKVGLTIEATEDELVGFVESIADGTRRSGASVVEWLAEHLAELD